MYSQSWNQVAHENMNAVWTQKYTKYPVFVQCTVHEMLPLIQTIKCNIFFAYYAVNQHNLLYFCLFVKTFTEYVIYVFNANFCAFCGVVEHAIFTPLQCTLYLFIVHKKGMHAKMYFVRSQRKPPQGVIESRWTYVPNGGISATQDVAVDFSWTVWLVNQSIGHPPLSHWDGMTKKVKG